MFKRKSLRFRLMLTFLLLGIVPAGVVGGLAWTAGNKIRDGASKQLFSHAASTSDKIDRNLFERYGDVQAFGLNHAVLQRDDWYKPGEEDNSIVVVMNRYVDTYDIYYLTLLVDLDGKLIAVNDKDADGEPLDTTGLYEQNFGGEQWFEDGLAGRFYASNDGSFTGTVVEHLYIDPQVRSVYENDDALALGFSAPVRGENGDVIAMWKNVAKFSLVEEIFVDTYQTLKRDGLTSGELTLLDEHGNVIIDYDPSKVGHERVVHDLENVILKLNLAAKGVEAAVRAVNGEEGYTSAFHARKKIQQTAAYHPLRGALGFPGMKWSVLVRVPETESLAAMMSLRWMIGVSLAVAVAVILFTGTLTTRSITRPINRIIAGLNEGADQVNDAAAQVSSASQQLAEGASEQASSLEETSSALEQMAAMTRTNAENAKQANELSDQAKTAAQNGDQTMGQLNEAMTAINESSGQISKIIKVIEEIAFQTNLLALNAAVEAARAGEHGKGFAVVADEVRNLAQRAAQASAQITGLIENSVGKVREGTNVAGEVGKALGAIVGDVTQVCDLVNGITRASEEQAQGVDQVNTAVSQMDKVTQQNASGAEESASASEELAAQAANVKGMVDELAGLVGGSRSNGATTSTGLGSNTRKPGKKPRVNVAHLPPKGTKTLSESGSLVAAGHDGANADSSEEFLSLDDEAGLKGF